MSNNAVKSKIKKLEKEQKSQQAFMAVDIVTSFGDGNSEKLEVETIKIHHRSGRVKSLGVKYVDNPLYDPDYKPSLMNEDEVVSADHQAPVPHGRLGGYNPYAHADPAIERILSVRAQSRGGQPRTPHVRKASGVVKPGGLLN